MTSSYAAWNATQEVAYALAASATLPAKLWRQNSEVNSPVVELSDAIFSYHYSPQQYYT